MASQQFLQLCGHSGFEMQLRKRPDKGPPADEDATAHKQLKIDPDEKLHSTIVEAGRDFTSNDNEGNDVIKMLARVGFHLHSVDSRERSVLHLSIEKTNNVKLAKALLEHGASFDCTTRDGTSPLHSAASKPTPHCQAFIALLLRHGAQLHVRDRHNRTPLRRALVCANRAAVHLLIAAGSSAADATSSDVVSYFTGLAFTTQPQAYTQLSQDLNLLVKAGLNISSVEEDLERYFGKVCPDMSELAHTLARRPRSLQDTALIAVRNATLKGGNSLPTALPSIPLPPSLKREIQLIKDTKGQNLFQELDPSLVAEM